MQNRKENKLTLQQNKRIKRRQLGVINKWKSKQSRLIHFLANSRKWIARNKWLKL